MKRRVLLFGLFLLISLSLVNFVNSSNYPTPFVIENSSADVAIIYGTGPGTSSLEVIQAGNIQTNLGGKLGIYTLGDVLVKDTKLNLVANKNLIVLGTLQNGCSNSAIAKMLGKETCSEVVERLNLKKGEYLIEVVNNPSASGKIALLLVGYGPSDLVEASQYLRDNFFNTSIGSKYTKTISIPEEICIDSDGENYNLKGNVTFNGNVTLDSCGFFSNPDSMASFTHNTSGKLLQEYSCDYYNHLASIIDECPNGCKDGACVIEANNLNQIINPVWLVYDDKAPTAFDLIILGNLQTWLKSQNIVSYIKKNSEVTVPMMWADTITVFVYNKKVTIFYGGGTGIENLSIWAKNIKTYFEEQTSSIASVCSELVKVCEPYNGGGCRNTGELNIGDKLKEYKCNDKQENELSQVIGTVQLVYSSEISTSLDLISLQDLQEWLKDRRINSELKKSTELNLNSIDKKITVFIYNKSAVVIYGENVDSSLSIIQAENIRTYLIKKSSENNLPEIVCPLVKSDSIKEDIDEYLCSEIYKIDAEMSFISPTEESGPLNIENVTSDYLCNGCELDKKCYPLGYRKSDKFCSDNLEFKNQLNPDDSCENNFECSSNVCVSGECVSEGLINKILNWFKRLFS